MKNGQRFHMFSRVTWTGGSVPTAADLKRQDLRAMRSLLFRELLLECGGLDLWVCAGTSSMERARLFWNQATLNAWASYPARDY